MAHLGVNFHRSIIVADLWRPEVTKLGFFCEILAFLEKRPLLENFRNSVPREFTASLINVLYSDFVKFGRREICEIVCYLPDKKKQKFA